MEVTFGCGAVFCSEHDKNLSRIVAGRHRWPKEIGRPPVPSRAKRRFQWAPWCQQGVRQIATFVDLAGCSIVLVETEFPEGPFPNRSLGTR